ncbi:hypothetical protein HK405_007250 [Cladochytrium tenue]|nr:hypothetical protein HK405_007250 [Cladochytrium tenue]
MVSPTPTPPPPAPPLPVSPGQAVVAAAPHARFGWAVPAVGVIAFAVADFSSASRRLALVAAAAVSFLGFRWLLGACTRAAICYTASNSGKPGFERRWAIHHLAAAVVAALSGTRVPVCLPPLAAMPAVSRLHLSELFPDLQRAADEVATALRAVSCEQPCSAVGAAILAAAAAYVSAIASYTARVAARAAGRAGQMLIPLPPTSTAEPSAATATAMKTSSAVDTTPTVATNEAEDEPVVAAARTLLTGPPRAVAPAVTVPHLRALVAQLDDAWLGALAVDTAAAYRQLAEELQEQQKSELQQRKKMAKTGGPTPPVSPPAADDAVLQRLAELVVMAREGSLPRGVALDMARGLAPRIGATIKGMAADLLGECAASGSYAVPASVADRIVRSRATALVIEAPKDAGPGVSLVLASALMLGGGALVALDVAAGGLLGALGGLLRLAPASAMQRSAAAAVLASGAAGGAPPLGVGGLVAGYLKERCSRPLALGASGPAAARGVQTMRGGDERYFAEAATGAVGVSLGPLDARVRGPSAAVEALAGPNVVGAYADPRLARVELDVGPVRLDADLNLRTGLHAGVDGAGFCLLGVGIEVGSATGLKLATPLGSVSLFSF